MNILGRLSDPILFMQNSSGHIVGVLHPGLYGYEFVWQDFIKEAANDRSNPAETD